MRIHQCPMSYTGVILLLLMYYSVYTSCTALSVHCFTMAYNTIGNRTLHHMIIVQQVSWIKRWWPFQSACCIITCTVHPCLDIVGNKVIIYGLYEFDGGSGTDADE